MMDRTSPSKASGPSRLGTVAAIGLLMTGGLVPVYPSPCQATFIAVAGLAVLLLLRQLRHVFAPVVDAVLLFAMFDWLARELGAERDGPRPAHWMVAAIDSVAASVAALAGVCFLFFWALVYLLIWSLDNDSFSNDVGADPRIGEFLFISASGALGGTPEGVEALSAWSQTAVTLELLSAVVLVSVYVASFRG